MGFCLVWLFCFCVCSCFSCIASSGDASVRAEKTGYAHAYHLAWLPNRHRQLEGTSASGVSYLSFLVTTYAFLSERKNFG